MDKVFSCLNFALLPKTRNDEKDKIYGIFLYD